MDSLGRLLQETQNGRVVSATYEGWEQKDLIYPTNARTVRRVYDELGRTDMILDLQKNETVADYLYQGPGRVIDRQNPWAQTDTTITYDGLRRVTRVRHQSGSFVFDDRGSIWSPASIKISRSDDSQVSAASSLSRDVRHDYGYDSAYQLVSSTRTVGGVAETPVTYDLDGVANRRSVTGGPNPGAYAPPLDPVNEYAATPLDQRAHDANGNLTTITAGATVKDIRYDHRNQMVACDLPGPSLFTYAYDVFGRRISKTVDLGAGGGPQTTEYVYWGNQVIEEHQLFGSTPVLAATYVYGLGLRDPLVREVAGTPYFFHSDDLGNVGTVTTLAAGAFALSEAYEYSDYGIPLDAATRQPLTSSAIGNQIFFQGQRIDVESGLYCFGYRYYDPYTGRFTTRDPIGIWGDPGNFGNGYSFAGNSPWTLTDPLGLSSYDPLRGHVGPVTREQQKAANDQRKANQEAAKCLRKRLGKKGYRAFRKAMREFRKEFRKLDTAYKNLLANYGEGDLLPGEMTLERASELFEEHVESAFLDIVGTHLGTVFENVEAVANFDSSTGSFSFGLAVANPIPSAGGSTLGRLASAGLDYVDKGFRLFVFDYKNPIGGSYWLEGLLTATLIVGDEGAEVRLAEEEVRLAEEEVRLAEEEVRLARGGTRPGDLPARGTPNSTDVVDRGGGKGTIRDYGPDGKAKTDYDFGHDHKTPAHPDGAGDPHAHDWDWSKPSQERQPPRPLKPGE